MNKPLFTLLLAGLLLSGCAARNPAPTEPPVPPPAVQTETQPAPNVISMDLLSEEGPVQQYTLSENILGFLPVENNLLIFSGEDTTALTLLDSASGKPVAVHAASVLLTPQNATVRILDCGISYFDSNVRETVILDNSLREIRRISIPEDMTGMPLLSRDCRSLYYCTSSAVRVLDTDTGISRILKEASYPVQSVSGLLLKDTVLQLSITEADGTWQTLFLSTENGKLLYGSEGNILPETSDTQFFLPGPSILLCGSADGPAMILEPRKQDISCWYLPGSNRAVSAGLAETGTVFECYDLHTGRRISELALPGSLFPEHATEAADGSVWFLTAGDNGPLLFRWDPDTSSVSDDTLYIHPYYTRSDPDYDGLAACSLYAQKIGEAYGIEVLVYKDAAATEPWDYHLEYEYQSTVLHRELQSLEKHLANFPEGFLDTLRNRFPVLKIGIVRNITGSPESGSPAAVSSIQFLDGYDAYIMLAADHNTEYALYHELSHLMETVILTESTAYDRWNELNPEDFVYDDSVSADRDGSIWLQPGQEYFIDPYSMSHPKEDRARLFEYAMTSGHEERFRSPHLQSKLKHMCIGIRESFGLKTWSEPLLWEQYLEQ